MLKLGTAAYVFECGECSVVFKTASEKKHLGTLKIGFKRFDEIAVLSVMAVIAFRCEYYVVFVNILAADIAVDFEKKVKTSLGGSKCSMAVMGIFVLKGAAVFAVNLFEQAVVIGRYDRFFGENEGKRICRRFIEVCPAQLVFVEYFKHVVVKEHGRTAICYSFGSFFVVFAFYQVFYLVTVIRELFGQLFQHILPLRIYVGGKPRTDERNNRFLIYGFL